MHFRVGIGCHNVLGHVMKGAFGLPTQIITLLFNTILEDSRKCGCINMFLNAWARILGLMTLIYIFLLG